MDVGFGPQPVTLESRYVAHDTPVLLSGIQALVRVLLEQARLDRAAGRRTGGLVSGYRGSPLGGLDQELWRREALLTASGIRFQPGLNEDLAATMLWGTQQIAAFAADGPRVEGVFGMWYGKGPGVDRSADALRCANMLGTAPLGGVLAVAGDDHAAHSSTFPHQTDQIFEAVMMPVLAPADVGDIFELGLAGIALSRFSGLWTALKTIAETAEQARTVVLPSRRSFALPADVALPPHGLNYDAHLHWPAQRAELERRVIEERLPAALAWARANRLDRLMAGAADAPIGLVAIGKAYHDTMHALALLGLAGDPRIAVYKVAMTWPLETAGLAAFARGKRAVLVIEEKRAHVETQLRAALYNLPADQRPPLAGKTDVDGAPLLPAVMELAPGLVAAALARFLGGAGLAVATPSEAGRLTRPEGLIARTPTFCAGCPHSTSTRVPQGSRATAGIGCHIMALEHGDATRSFSQMGGEGVHWLGLAPFMEMPHVFANMGDGTYQHSGLLAIRQAVATKIPITYKILFNDAVAMTGGQAAEGGPSVVAIARQVAAEGVARIAVVADDEARLPPPDALPPGTTRHGRDALDAVQRDLRDYKGVSVLIYDQVCATEKRRRRKRGTMQAAAQAVRINARVCENCGDCTVQSGCIAIEPIATPFGRKRRISPTACNTDLSCLKGFCPSFVTTSAAPPPPADVWAAQEAALAATLPSPAVVPPRAAWRGLFAGIGGGGIVTTGAIVAMAAHLDGLHVATLDFTGLAQKNGAVVAHVQVAPGPIDVVRIPVGEADFMLAADLAVAAGAGVLECCRAGSEVVGNLDLQSNAAFLTSPDLRLDGGLHQRTIARLTGPGAWLRAAAVSEALFGHSQAMNTLLLGLAWQRGAVPVSEAALLRAIELNGTAVALNRRAFLWGRILAEQPELADRMLSPEAEAAPEALDALIEARAAELVAYQNESLARRYRALVAAAVARETALAGAPGRLARAVAENWFRLLAYKDEYEVARLHAAASYGPNPVFHLAPPLLSRPDPATGRRRKIRVPGWLALPLFRLLRHGRVLRGTPLDPFGMQPDRRLERALIAQYEQDITAALATDDLARATALAELPAGIRGFGPVKAAGAAAAAQTRTALLQESPCRFAAAAD
jgi:indolepyruvate ferredoxin oxidoreductase